jgi:hypothetical protein
MHELAEIHGLMRSHAIHQMQHDANDGAGPAVPAPETK